jgi:hypothetical protein
MRDRLNIPKITEADRAAGFLDWPVLFCDGHTETLRVYRPDPMQMVAIVNLDSMTQQVYTTIAHALGEGIAFVFDIHGKSIVELFWVANGLDSVEAFLLAWDAFGEIGEAMIQEAGRDSGNN